MSDDVASKCRSLLSHENDDKLADRIQEHCPDMVCEGISVGAGSPGPVLDSEDIHRILVSPRDFDEDDQISEQAFDCVRRNGLSVIRSICSEREFSDLVRDGFESARPDVNPTLNGVLTARVKDVRNLSDAEGSRLFGVYDQTVSRARPEDTPVPTHAGVFLHRPLAKTEGRKRLQKDYRGMLYRLFCSNRERLETFRNGAFRADGSFSSE